MEKHGKTVCPLETLKLNRLMKLKKSIKMIQNVPLKEVGHLGDICGNGLAIVFFRADQLRAQHWFSAASLSSSSSWSTSSGEFAHGDHLIK
jgi:hypothetical protein